MSNGKLNKELRVCNKLLNKTNKKNNSKKSNNNKNTRCKNSTTKDSIDNISNASTANPFTFKKKDITYWSSEEGLLYLESWANDGLTNQELAEKMGIGETTLYRWSNADERIRIAIMRGRDMSTIEVENTLYKCARGFTYTEQQVTKDGDIVEVERYYPPNAEAQKFILTNRRRDKWKSKQEVALEAQVQAQAQVQATTKVVTAEDVARSIIGADETREEEFDFPDIPDEIDNGA